MWKYDKGVKMRRVRRRAVYKAGSAMNYPKPHWPILPRAGLRTKDQAGLVSYTKTRILCQWQRGNGTDAPPRFWGWHSKRENVSMGTGTLEMFSGITPWGSATNRNICRQRPKYSCIQVDSSSPGLGWNVALEQMHWLWPDDVFNILQCLHYRQRKYLMKM